MSTIVSIHVHVKTWLALSPSTPLTLRSPAGKAVAASCLVSLPSPFLAIFQCQESPNDHQRATSPTLAGSSPSPLGGTEAQIPHHLAFRDSGLPPSCSLCRGSLSPHFFHLGKPHFLPAASPESRSCLSSSAACNTCSHWDDSPLSWDPMTMKTANVTEPLPHSRHCSKHPTWVSQRKACNNTLT